MKKTLGLTLLVTVSLLSCKMLDKKPAANCNASAVPENEFCFEYSERDFTDAKGLCTKWTGTWSTGPCTRANALGACKLSDGITKVFYSGTQFKSADEAKLKCMGKWVGPTEN